MSRIILRLQQYEELSEATRVADAIREAGEVRYDTGTGEMETAFVSDVTVEDGSTAGRTPGESEPDEHGQSVEGQQGKVRGQEEGPLTRGSPD